MQAAQTTTRTLDFAEVYACFSSSLEASDLPASVLAACAW
jgi:hypothetical protein